MYVHITKFNERESMNILSVFDGISAARLAIDRLGIKGYNYFSCEIDKDALYVAKNNYLDSIYLGDIKNLQNADILPKIDLLIGGSPCQNLSVAGDRTGLQGEKSKLFWEYVRVLKLVKPRYFVLENVASMKKADRDIISQTLGVEPIMLDSADFSAQMRKRYYWTNISVEQPNTISDEKLADILENGYTERDKALCLTATYGRACLRDYFEKHSRQLIFNTPVMYDYPHGYNQGGFKEREKSPTLRGSAWQHNHFLLTLEDVLESQVDDKYYIEPTKAVKILDAEVSKRKIAYIGTNSQGSRIYNIFGKAVSINANGGGWGAKTGLYALPCLTPDKVNKRQQGKRFKPPLSKFYTLTAMDRHGVFTNNYLRKLTPKECERLQTFPDGWTEGLSDNKRYKLLGNAFTVSVIEYVLKGIRGLYV